MSYPYLIDSDRLAAIEATHLLDTPAEECFDQYTREAKRLLGAQMGIVSLVMADRQFYKSCLGLVGPLENRRESPIAFSLCKIGVEKRDVVIIRDGPRDPKFQNHPAITELKLNSYLGVPLFDENDHALGTLCVANLTPYDWTDGDIATLKILAQGVRNEIRLRKLEIQRRASRDEHELLGGILETSIAAIVVLSADGRIIYCNRGAEAVLGLSPSDVEGRTYDDPEWKSTAIDGGPWPDEKQPFSRVLATGQAVYDIQHAIEWPGGARRILSVSGAPLRDDKGKIAQVVFLISDITDKYEASQRLESVASQFQKTFRISPNFAVLCRCDDQQIVEVSDGFLDTLKLTREACTGKRLDELNAGFGSGEVGLLYAEGNWDGTELMELRLRAADDELRVVAVRAQMVEVGVVRYVRMTGHDLTRQRAAEQRRMALEVQLREAQRTEAVGQLAGGLAHDFNNILTAIIGNAELTSQIVGPHHAAQRPLGVIKKAGQRAVDQVRQILSASNRDPGEARTVDVTEVTLECVDLMRSQLPPAIRVKVERPAERVVVPATGSRLHQILMNLLTNASHAVEGEGTITVRIDPYAQDATKTLTSEDEVVIEVIDDGVGIDPVNRDLVFDAFFTTKDSETGSGIGLTLARTIARGFGGEIVFESELGEGTTFRLTLPRICHGNQDQANSRDPFGLRAGKPSANILLVDDDEEVLVTGCMILEELGHTVATTSDAEAALKSLCQQDSAYDLLITDNLMPNMTGIQLIEALRDQGNDMPAILVSGYGTAMTQIEKLKNRKTMFVPKPFSITEISDAIQLATE